MFVRLANLCVSVDSMFSCHGTFQPCLRLNSSYGDRNQRNSALSPTRVRVWERSLQGHHFICSNWFLSAIWLIHWMLLTISQPFDADLIQRSGVFLGSVCSQDVALRKQISFLHSSVAIMASLSANQHPEPIMALWPQNLPGDKQKSKTKTSKSIFSHVGKYLR